MTVHEQDITGEFLADGLVLDEIKVRNRRLVGAVEEMQRCIERMAHLTHNRFHRELGTNWRACTMISCRLARQQLDKRGVTA